MKLFNHQQEAIDFAIRNNGRFALFNEPGLGKTRTCLEIFSHYKKSEPELRLLVVCPLSLVNSAWGADIKKFTGFTSTPFKSMSGTVPDIVIVNYEALISKRHLPGIKSLIAQYDFMCVLDESSRLKNNNSVTTETLLELAPQFKYRIVASGTPMPNSELELWGQLSFVNDGILPESFYAYRNKYFHLERKGKQMHLAGQYMSKKEMQTILSKGWKYTISSYNRQVVMAKIQPHTHWMKKADALDLPDKIDQVREIELTVQELKAYRDMERHLVAEIDGEEITAPVALTKLMKLRQATSGFFYTETGGVVQIGRSSKLKELEEILEELGDQQVIIWVQFHYEVESIKSFIEKKYGDDQVVTLYSGTNDREDSINRFKNNDARYLIAHPRSAAHGHTFTLCNTMIFYSLDYSYEAYVQARDRIHRISQKNACLYIHLIAKNTIDEEILAVVQKKQSLQDIVYGIVRKSIKRKSHAVYQSEIPECVAV
ncbi:MAG: DEAD/DEAH box helicase [Candidatus Auribacterota bacterium]|jgi:SNF2 family DNA or RNA helicase|nr:DEAD/DEAH box helicase [Candidatus Auribacterota bacterium]